MNPNEYRPVTEPRKSKTLLFVIISIATILVAGIITVLLAIVLNNKFTVYEADSFSFQYPKEWKVQLSETTTSARDGITTETIYVSAPEYPTLQSSTITDEERSKVAILGIVRSDLSKVLEDDYNNPEFPSSSRKLLIDDRKAVIQESQTYDGYILDYAYIIDDATEKQYLITLSYPTNQSSTYEGLFEQILETIKLK